MIEAPPITDPWDLLPNLEAAAVFLATLAFIVIYARYSDWTKTGPGKALMLWAVTFDALILMNTVHLATGRYPGIIAVRVAVYGALFLSVCYLVGTLIRILRDGHTLTFAATINPHQGATVSTLNVQEIWFKSQRVIRTVLAVIVSILTTFASTVLALDVFAPQIIDELAKVLPPEWIAWLIAALAAVAVVAGVITRIMAIPQVNVFLTWLGAGSVPKVVAENGLESPTGTTALDGK